MEATAKVQQIFEQIKGLTLLELKQLTDLFKEEFGVTASAPIAVAPASVYTGAPLESAQPAVEEKTEFKVILKGIVGLEQDEKKKLPVIKAVREIVPGLLLQEAKKLVESVPSVVKEGIGKDEAQKIKEKLESVGATVVIE